jgi:Virulence-associated protein E
MSGGGLHIYWPLKAALPRAEWLPYANGLKAACLELGLKADQKVTSDLARVLRPPGTHNRKLLNPRKVELNPRFLEIEPYELKQFEPLLKYVSGGVARPTAKAIQFEPLPPRREYLKDFASSRPAGELLKKLLGGIGYDPDDARADAHMIADQCGQLGRMRETHGDHMYEPAWHGCILVLSRCKDGEALAHKWSKGDSRYDAKQTQERFDRVSALTGPTTCTYFLDCGGETRKICEACSHLGKITTPLSLGEVVNDQEAQPRPLTWELTASGRKKEKCYHNAIVAIEAIGIKGRYDVFHDRKIVEGDLVENLGPALSDAVVRAVRETIVARFGCDPGKDNVQEALERLCERNRFDPVCDHLDGLSWDRKPRLDRWLIDYTGAEDTPLNRAFGRKTLLAAGRRARRPGCKFDFMPVLEGPQGVGKSSAVEILAVSEDNYSDQPIKWDDPNQQQETVSNKWICEVGELVGLRKADVENVKNFLSRTKDRARPAYGRYVEERPRRGICIGTVNGGKAAGYLTDRSGGRRFWPIEVGAIDLEALRRDRDQLWAEAAALEKTGECLSIDPNLYEAAAGSRISGARRIRGRTSSNVEGERFPHPDGPVERISSTQLLTGHLMLPAAQQNHAHALRLGAVMRQLGWKGPVNMRLPQRDSAEAKGTPVVKGYERPAPGG